MGAGASAADSYRAASLREGRRRIRSIDQLRKMNRYDLNYPVTGVVLNVQGTPLRFDFQEEDSFLRVAVELLDAFAFDVSIVFLMFVIEDAVRERSRQLDLERSRAQELAPEMQVAAHNPAEGLAVATTSVGEDSLVPKQPCQQDIECLSQTSSQQDYDCLSQASTASGDVGGFVSNRASEASSVGMADIRNPMHVKDGLDDANAGSDQLCNVGSSHNEDRVKLASVESLGFVPRVVLSVGGARIRFDFGEEDISCLYIANALLGDADLRIQESPENLTCMVEDAVRLRFRELETLRASELQA